jgi:adenylate kinase
VRLILLGPPGAGKGTQARLLGERFGIPQIASGDLLRAAADAGTPAGLEARRKMDRGELVPDDLVIKLVEERLARPDAAAGFILDGFPRSVRQAEQLGALLAARGIEIDRVLAVIVPDQEIVRRISGRRTCRKCAAMYHVVSDPPAREGICDRCGGELYQRDDDREATVRKRIDVYARSTRPLLQFYGRAGMLSEIDAMGRPDEVFKRILAALKGLENANNRKAKNARARRANGQRSAAPRHAR